MTVADFITWLQTQDQGATVQVVLEERHGQTGYEPYTTTSWVDFDPEHHVEYIDLRGNQFCNPPSDRRYLELGCVA